ncbi:MAG TPA: hypothetical protein VGC42_09325 [Kofleriaceae bacterium]
MSFVRSLAGSIAGKLARWPFALLACALLAAALLLPRLGTPGLWEPQERQLADRVAPPLIGAPPPSTAAPAPVSGKDGCLRTAPSDAQARTLTARAVPWGRDHVGDSDTGRRLPLAIFGWLTVLAAAGTAMRLAGPRAGLLATIVLLAMPIATLQSRMLTSEVGTACGTALIIYGGVALSAGWRGRRFAVALADAVVGALALAAGAALGFYGGGALLGWAAPLGALAAAGGLGLGKQDRAAGRLVALFATLAALAVLALLASQVYDLKPLYPGLTPPPAREILGRAIIPTGCYSWALGGVWRPDEDLRIIYDSTFEQIAYGTFPWGLVAPIAMAMLTASADPRRRRLGALSLAWAGAAWIAGEAFQRKVGFTVFAGFPALAIAIGGWLDDLLAPPPAFTRPPGAILIALFFVLGAIDLGKDLQSFAERLTSLFVGNDAVPYPAQTRFLWLPTKLWVLILGAIIALGFAVAIVQLDRAARRRGVIAALVSLGASLLLGVFWTSIWQPRLALHLSSKALLETYQDLARPGDSLIVLGDLGQSAVDYTGKPAQTATDRAQVIAALGHPDRVFAIAPQSELCTLHREVAGRPYFVIDDRNQRSLLISNKLDGAEDHNPLRTTILHQEPKAIAARPKARVVWDGKLQLLGWDVPARIDRGAAFEVTAYYKVLQPVGGSWKALLHVDGPAGRAGNGDHDPINGRCPTSTWQPGDYIVDHFTARAGGPFPLGRYDIWIGFFTGAAPSWHNMTISEAPGDMRDTTDRVKITSVIME